MPYDPDDHPGLIVPPPVVFIIGIAIGLAADFFWPLPLIPSEVRIFFGGFLILVSFIPALWVFRLFVQARTNVDPRKATHKIVMSGPFQWSRNPIYLSLSVLYIGIGVAADSIWVLLLLVPVIIAMNRLIIQREEAYLEQKFGEEYLNYKATVRRWL